MPKAVTCSHSRTHVKGAAPYPPVERVAGSSDGTQHITDPSFDIDTDFAADLGDVETEEGKEEEEQGDEGPSSTSATESTTNTEDVYIPRPQNKFMLFRTEMCSRGVPELSKVTKAGEKSQIIARLWKALKAEEKEIWGERAEAAKKEHERQYPDYKFHPKPRQPKLPKRPKSKRVKSVSKRVYKPKKVKGSESSIIPQETTTASPVHHAPRAQTSHAAEPALDTTFFQPGSDAFQADWFDFSSFGMRPSFNSELQNRFGPSPVADNRIHAPHHLPNQMPVTAPSAPVVQFNVFPSMPLYAQTDLYGRLNSGLLTTNDASLGPSSFQVNGSGWNNSFGQWPTLEKDFNGNVAGSFDSPGSSSSGLSNYSPRLGDVQPGALARPYWDFVTPDEPVQADPLSPSWASIPHL